MTTELRDLYQDLILDHGKQPRNFRTLQNARMSEGRNPLCGDQVAVYVDLVNNVLEDVTFQGVACAIATASASMMTQTVKGKSLSDVARLLDAFHLVVTRGLVPPDPELGDWGAFADARRFPSRVKCALLAWQTLRAALG